MSASACTYTPVVSHWFRFVLPSLHPAHTWHAKSVFGGRACGAVVAAWQVVVGKMLEIKHVINSEVVSLLGATLKFNDNDGD